MEQDPLIEKLVPDPSEPPRVSILTGWLGRSQRKGYWRLYVTSSLDEYLEFREEDVRHYQSLRTDESPLGGTVVWVREGAEILRTTSTGAATEREFLRGEIARAFLARGSTIPTFPGLPPRAVNTVNCTNPTAGTCTLVLCTRVEECKISREANPCV
jgi:hypothetical protein